MEHQTPRRFRALVLRPVRNCPTCAHDVTVHDDTCDECGTHVPRPAGGTAVAQTHLPLMTLPATAFGLEQAAAVAGSLDVAAWFSLN
ncbi:MAG TPA: hypothetical protein VG650_11330 [Mycobacteriales bacterium]|nr:hypothetical protein [Mycobacteriales bacterium]